ncbi:MAG TPA: Xaa-Pro peptidase family protein, partial [Acidimicrobiia bacterium]|nr:Xaa-Pro peptidase family protein [Acidimicrobiia bacterium]
MAVDYPERIARAQAEMVASRVDVLLLSLGADLLYLTGYEATPTERLTMLVLPVIGEATLVIPELEAPRVAEGPFRLAAWKETQDPVAIIADLIPGVETAALGDQTWSVFLLRLMEQLSATRFVSATTITRPLRAIKEAAEIGALREAAHGVDRVVDRLRDAKFSGRTERDLARQVAAWTVEEGHDQAVFWIVASGANGASPHHEPTNRVIQQGDLVVVDFGGKVRRYGSDCTRTFSIGPPTSEQAEVHEAVRLAQAAAMASVRPGVTAESVDKAARSLITESGYGDYFIHRTGHGIGLETHEHPYLVNGNFELLEPGMCFSVEPGIYLPGRFGVRLEDIVTVTE